MKICTPNKKRLQQVLSVKEFREKTTGKSSKSWGNLFSHEPESALQADFAKWFDSTYQDWLMFSIPNGGKRSRLVAAKMKLTGVKRGVPDVFIARPSGPYHGLFIEFKTDGNPSSISDYQRIRIAQLQEQGYAVSICWTLQQAQDEIEKYFKNGGIAYENKQVPEVRSKNKKTDTKGKVFIGGQRV